MVTSFQVDACEVLELRLGRGPLLEAEWTYNSCELSSPDRSELLIHLASSKDPRLAVSVVVSFEDIPSSSEQTAELDPIGEVLLMLMTFSYQVAPTQALGTLVRLPLDWNPLS